MQKNQFTDIPTLTFSEKSRELYYSITLPFVVFSRKDYNVYVQLKSERYRLLYNATKLLISYYLYMLKKVLQDNTDAIFQDALKLNLAELSLPCKDTLSHLQALQDELKKELATEYSVE